MSQFLKKPILLWIILTLVFFFITFKLIKLDNQVLGGGDDQGYQILASNYADGHGWMVFNIYENKNYHFDNPDLHKDKLSKKNDTKIYSFYRTPGYPILFLGNIYKIFGNSPYFGKLAALFLLCFVAAGMPWLAKQFWGERGVLIGLIASPFQIAYTAHWCDRIVTEPLIIVALFLITGTFMVFKNKQNLTTSLFLSGSLVFGLLVKGSLLFIPFLILGYLAYQVYLKKIKPFLVLLSILVFTAIMLSWSNYASSKSNKRILLSTQYSHAILDGNNEYSNGWWAPEWTEHKDSFYNNDGLENATPIIRVANFYIHKPLILPKLLIKKLITGFLPQLFFILLILIWCFRACDLFLKTQKNRNRLFTSSVILMLIFSVIHVYIMADNNKLILFHNFIMKTPLIMFSLMIVIIGLCLLLYSTKIIILKQIHVLFKIEFINFFLLSIILFGDARYNMVMHFIFILLFVDQYIIYYNHNFKKTIITN